MRKLSVLFFLLALVAAVYAQESEGGGPFEGILGSLRKIPLVGQLIERFVRGVVDRLEGLGEAIGDNLGALRDNVAGILGFSDDSSDSSGESGESSGQPAQSSGESGENSGQSAQSSGESGESSGQPAQSSGESGESSDQPAQSSGGSGQSSEGSGAGPQMGYVNAGRRR